MLAVRRMGVAARRRAAPRLDRPLRVLRARSTPGPENTAGGCCPRPRRPRPAMPSSTAPGRAKARTSGSSQRVYPDGRDHHDRGQLRQPRRPSSAHSCPPTRPAQARQHRSTGTPSRPRRARAKAHEHGADDRWFAQWFALRFALRYALRFTTRPQRIAAFRLGGAGLRGFAFFDISICAGNCL